MRVKVKIVICLYFMRDKFNVSLYANGLMEIFIRNHKKTHFILTNRLDEQKHPNMYN